MTVAGLFFCVSLIPLQAGTIVVDPDNSADHTTIQGAINSASDNDEIEVAPGTYNEAIDFSGKAVRLYSSSGPEVTIIDGTGYDHVVLLTSGEDANTILDGFTITGGNADGTEPDNHGGGIYCKDSSPKIINCLFRDFENGGMYNENSSPTVINCTFRDNSRSEGSGGGMCNFYRSSPTVVNCIFEDNTALYGGGIDNHTECNPTLISCLFNSNKVERLGGGISSYNNSSPTLINCTFYGNTAGENGGGLHSSSGGKTTITNCIFWGDSPNEIDEYETTVSVSYSDIQGGYTGTGNINADPLFVDAAGGDLRLISSASPCVDTGDNSVVTSTTDLDGKSRVVDGTGDSVEIVDMGAFELQKRVRNITQDVLYPTIQNAIDNSSQGDQIEAGSGTYHEAINFSGKAIRLYASAGPEMTTIDSTGLGTSAVTCINSEDSNTVLEGFTLTGGTGTLFGNGYTYGGGMYNKNSSPTVTNCIFSSNSATGDGGGMYNDASSPTLKGCSFISNSAEWAGGGMDNRNASSPTVSNCVFSKNTAITNGGGIENLNNSDSTVINCTFSGNTARNNGGGIFNFISNSTVKRSTFTGNTALLGAGISNKSSSPEISNCLFREGVIIAEGLNYEYYQGVWDRIPDFDSITLFQSGMTNNFDITILPYSFNFGFRFTGFLKVPVDGLYTFYTTSDDGSQLFIDSKMVVDNDGEHAMLERSGRVGLVAGLHSITVTFFQSLQGKGLQVSWEGPTIEKMPIADESLFSKGNWSSTGYGAGIYNTNSNPLITNCTIFSNTASVAGGAIYNADNSSPTVTNCILRDNAPQEIANDSSSPVVSYSNVKGGTGLSWFGEGCIDTDPLFWKSKNDLTLSPWSPCIDAGTNDGIAPDSKDIRKLQRLVDGNCDNTVRVDMGCHEFRHNYMGDFNNDCNVNLQDFQVLADFWMTDSSDNLLCDIGVEPDAHIDAKDLSSFLRFWLYDTLEPSPCEAGVLAEALGLDAADILDRLTVPPCSLSPERAVKSLNEAGFNAIQAYEAMIEVYGEMGTFEAEQKLFAAGYLPEEYLEFTARYSVEEFAPILFFDRAHKGLPMSAQVYFETMMTPSIDQNAGTITWTTPWDGPCGEPNVVNVPGRDETNCGMHNTDFSTLINGKVPTYYRIISDIDTSVPTGPKGRLRIEYWWYYGFQRYCNSFPGASGEHHGDWEHITVTTTPDRSQIDCVTYEFHGDRYTRKQGGFLAEGNRPIAYVGKTAHGCYHSQEEQGFGDDGTSLWPHHCCEFADWRNPVEGSKWYNVNENLVSLRGSEPWMLADRLGSSYQYDGREYKVLHWRWGPHISYCVFRFLGGCTDWTHVEACGTHPTSTTSDWSLASCKGQGCRGYTEGCAYSINPNQGWPWGDGTEVAQLAAKALAEPIQSDCGSCGSIPLSTVVHLGEQWLTDSEGI